MKLFVFYRMKENNIGPHDRLICFGQLLGMCDHISFPLGIQYVTVFRDAL